MAVHNREDWHWKRLILNLDGTGQSESASKGVKDPKTGTVKSAPVSNIPRFGRAIEPDDNESKCHQIVYYLSGIGSSSDNTYLQKFKESGMGVGLVENVRQAYGFLCNNYDEGDEIYITGFSRGAFTARSVAGLVGKVGLLTKKGMAKFYEAFDFYEHPELYGNKCPVTAKDEIIPPRTNEPKIIIKAVGVWDTVGALVGDSAFHDVTLGEHIEHAYHILSLDESRGKFEPTLWEIPHPKNLEKLEQCWMPGDHSNVGGSWPDQQLADISLAWMMSRFEKLGVKFKVDYLYDEFLKSESNGNQWGEGKCESITAWKIYGGDVPRTPKMYKSPVETQGWFGFGSKYMAPSDKYLQNTNETVHPSARYRLFCSRNVTKNSTTDPNLGTNGSREYSPRALTGWTPPKAQKDGRVGKDSEPANSSEPLTWTKDRDGERVTMDESVMGKYEKILLALYDRQYSTNGSVWKAVLGNERQSEEVRAVLSQFPLKR